MELDLNEERRQKLEAGKERLAAFRKKKAKKKKAECEKPAASKEVIEPLNGGDLSPPDFPAWNDVLSAQDDSDQFFVSSDDLSSEEPESRSSVYYQAKLADAKQKISELEETVEGKQLALDTMTRQYEHIETQKIPLTDNLNFHENGSSDLTYSDMENALAQRDAIIAQLTKTLQTSAVELPAESDMLTQIQFLSQQVGLLQNQLEKSGQAMQEEARLRDISSSTLQAAKGQMLQLQTIVNDKDNALKSVCEQLESSQGCLQRLQNEKQDLIGDLSEKTHSLSNLSQKLENFEHLEDIASQWQEKENCLQNELIGKSEEIKALVESERQNEAVVGELRNDNQAKDERLQVLQVELEELKKLKADMENESRELLKENKELTAYHQNISASLSDNNALTAELDKSRQALADLSAQHEGLKSKCLLLDSVVDELKQENASSKSQLGDLKHQLEEEHQRHAEQEKAWLEMESQQKTYSDQLNNKLNDLQNRLSASEETLNDERQRLVDLQSQLGEKVAQHEELLSQVESKDEKIAKSEKLQLEYQNVSEKLQGKEIDFEKLKEELQGKSFELEKELQEVKAENEMLSEQTIKLKDDLLSAQHVHGVEMSEKEYRENSIEEQMELMNEELNAAIERSADLEKEVKERETDLMAECEKREAFEKQLTALELERDTLRETVQGLNADIGQLKEELAMETKAPVEEKIMAYENQQLSSALKKHENETEEKVQLTILEEEIMSLKNKLEERESTSQNLEDKLHRMQSQYSEELETSKSEILRLEKELESQVSQKDQLNEELSAWTSTSEKTKGELIGLEESCHAAGQELEELRKEVTDLEAKKEEASTRINVLECEVGDLKSACQALEHRERDLLKGQEDMEAQLSALHVDLQKSQEKETELQCHLEEETKKGISIAKTHEDELNSVRADTDKWKLKCKEGEDAIDELRNQLSDGKEQLESKESEASEALKTLSEKESLIRDLELKLSGREKERGDISDENIKTKEEISQLQSRLEESQQNIAMAQAEIEDIKTTLNAERLKKEAVLEKLDLKEKEVIGTQQVKEEVEQQMQDLYGQLENKQSHISDLSTKVEDLTSTISDLESRCSESNDTLCKQQHEISHLSESLKKLKLQNQRLEGLMASLAEDLQDKEIVLVEQNTSLLENTVKLNELNESLNERNQALKTLEESNMILLAEKEKLETDHQVFRNENQCLKEQVKKLEDEALMHQQDAVQLSLDAKKLQESITQARQEIDGKSSLIHDLTHDSEIQRKEISDLKTDVEEKECKIENINSELVALQTALDKSSEEKKQLKTNFDACMEDMQQKFADQEAESRRLKSQLVEESRSISEGQHELKEMYEQQMSQLDDKLSSAEREKTKLERDVSEAQEKSNVLSESYENQLSELEMSLQAANSECVRLNECIAKVNANFENEITDLRSLHEMQRSELLDNNMSLEKTIDELQKAINEKTERARVERGDLEQSFEVQMMELDEKRRYSESEVGRLKRHLDEMRKDHDKDAQNLEKRYETQLFELEDKCSIMGAELERARKSMMSVEGDFVEERKALELKVEDLENIRRELEIKISVLDDDLSNIKEQSQRREEEMKAILKNTAERQKNMENEIGCLTEELSFVKAEKESTVKSMKNEYEGAIEDLETRNKHLEVKVTSYEIHAEEDMALRNQEPLDLAKETTLRSQIAELKEQNAVLSDENLSLKRRLLSHKSSDKKILLSVGVEDICPSMPAESETVSHGLPKLVTSTPSKGFDSEDSFSPTVEEVSMIEGFVAERDQPVFSSLNMQLSDEARIGEPDFVAEEQDRFQPEMVIEKALESSEHGIQQHSIHPIREEAITEGFQPEAGDQFFMETIEEPNGVWPANLSVGKSPSIQEKQQFHFNDIPTPEGDFEKNSNPLPMSDQNTNCNVEQNPLDKPEGEGESVVTASEMTRKLADQKERLEEEYVTKMRNQKRDLVVEYECKKDEYQREMELHLTQRAQSIKSDWEHKFAKALQKVRRDVERRHLKELRQARQRHAINVGQSNVPEEQKDTNLGEEGMPNIAEGSEELDERVQQLSLENQELAEARDELLKEIEISQIWGQHHRVQHELQSKISGKESPVFQLSPTHTVTSESPVVEDSPILSASHTPTNTSPIHGDTSTALPAQIDPSSSPADEYGVASSDNKVVGGPRLDNVSSEADMNDTGSGGEGFLEEFTDISQQSSQDLPLEWELTLTLDDVGEFERDPQHESVWEVFDGRCLRQDCQEVRQLYRRLFQFLVKCNVDGEDLLSEESGLVLPSNVDNVDNLNDDNNEGCFSGSNSTFSDVQDLVIEEPLSSATASAFIAALKSEKEQLSDLFSEHLKTDLYEILQENEDLRLRLAEESKFRQRLEKKCIEEIKEERPVESMKDVMNSVQIDPREGYSIYSNSKLERPSVSDESKHVCDKCNKTVQSLNLALLHKEHALLELAAELSDLKSFKSNGSELELGRLIVLRDEVDSLTKEVKFKDRVIKNLREDLNKLVYPKLPPPGKSDSGSSKGQLSETSETPGTHPSVLDLSSSTCASGENNSIKSSSHNRLNTCLSSPLDYTNVEANLASEEETGNVHNEDVIVKHAMTAHPNSERGFEAEVAAGEDLALITQHDIDDATKQCGKLSDEEREESPVLESANILMNREILGGNVRKSSVGSSSSGSTLPSQFNTPEHSRKSTPPALELQDQVLAQELNKLRKDLQETRAIYSKENSLLQEALDRDRVAKESVDTQKKELDVNSMEQKRYSLQSETEKGKMLTEEEVTILRQRLTICLEQNKMLEEENTSLRARIREQDAVVLIVKQKLLEKERCSDEWRQSMNHQLQCLQQQRDDLLQLLRNVEDGNSPSLSEAMGQAALKEESLRQAQENLMEKMEELDHLHQMLTQRQIELQHCEAERRHLEQLCLLKDQTEMQLMKQKRLMEEQVTEIELRLRERETSLVDDKTRLLHELREKDQQLSQMSLSTRSSPIPSSASLLPRSSSLGDLNTGLLEALNTTRRHDTSQTQSNSSSVDDVDRQHMEAIDKLKQKLKLEYDLRAARMAESQASAIASYWHRHGKSS